MPLQKAILEGVQAMLHAQEDKIATQMSALTARLSSLELAMVASESQLRPVVKHQSTVFPNEMASVNPSVSKPSLSNVSNTTTEKAPTVVFRALGVVVLLLLLY